MRGRPLLPRPLDVLGVVVDVAAVEHGVLGGADVDERGLHAGQHVLHPAQVDVAVDLRHVVGGPRHVVLDQRAALEHGDLGGLVADVHAHRVAADGPALALASPPALERLLVELGGLVGDHRLDRLAAPAALAGGWRGACCGAALAPAERPRPPAAPPALAASPPSSAPSPSSPCLGPLWRRASGGMLSPILGRGGGDLGTSAAAAASTEAGRPSRCWSGSSGLRSLSAALAAGRVRPRPRPPDRPSRALAPLRPVVPPPSWSVRRCRRCRRCRPCRRPTGPIHAVRRRVTRPPGATAPACGRHRSRRRSARRRAVVAGLVGRVGRVVAAVGARLAALAAASRTTAAPLAGGVACGGRVGRLVAGPAARIAARGRGCGALARVAGGRLGPAGSGGAGVAGRASRRWSPGTRRPCSSKPSPVGAGAASVSGDDVLAAVAAVPVGRWRTVSWSTERPWLAGAVASALTGSSGPGSAPPGRKRLSRTWVEFPSHDARPSACGGGVAAGPRSMTSCRAPPACVHWWMRVTRATTQVGSTAAISSAGRSRGAAWPARPRTRWPLPSPGGRGGHDLDPTGPSTRRSRMAGRTSSVTVLPLPLTGERRARWPPAPGRRRPRPRSGRRRRPRCATCSSSRPAAASRTPAAGPAAACTSMPDGQRRVEQRGQGRGRRQVRRIAQRHVEVLAERLVPGREREPEAELGPGREALGVGDGRPRPGAAPAPRCGRRRGGW